MLVVIPVQAVVEVPSDDNVTSYNQALEAKAKIEAMLQKFNLVMLLTSQGIRVRSVSVELPQQYSPPQQQQTQQQPQQQHTNGRR